MKKHIRRSPSHSRVLRETKKTAVDSQGRQSLPEDLGQLEAGHSCLGRGQYGGALEGRAGSSLGRSQGVREQTVPVTSVRTHEGHPGGVREGLWGGGILGDLRTASPLLTHQSQLPQRGGPCAAHHGARRNSSCICGQGAGQGW